MLPKLDATVKQLLENYKKRFITDKDVELVNQIRKAEEMDRVASYEA